VCACIALNLHISHLEPSGADGNCYVLVFNDNSTLEMFLESSFMLLSQAFCVFCTILWENVGNVKH